MSKKIITIIAISCAGMSYGQVSQCTGLTKDSVQCENITTSVKKLCYYHNPDYVKVENKTTVCSGTTKKGKNCKNKTKDLSGKCHNHRND